MDTQLRAWCVGVLEAAALVAVTSVPVFVNFYGFRVFELGKSSLTIAIGLLVAVAGVVALVEGRFGGIRRALRQPLVVAATLLWAATAIATALSMHPSLSFFGSQARAQGLMTMSAAVVLFAGVAAAAPGDDRRRRIVAALIAGTVPVALFAITQWLGIEAVPGKVESAGRAFGTLSNPIFLGAYLMLVLPLTLVEGHSARRSGRIVLSGALLLVAAMQLAGLAVTASRGPQLGLLTGLIVLGLALAAIERSRALAVASMAVAVLAAVGLLALNQPTGPLASVADAPIVGRFAEIGDVNEGSQATRLMVWEAVDRLVSSSSPKAFVVGHGPETLKYVLLPHTGPNVGGKGQSDRLVDRAHSVTLDEMVSTGALGLLARLVVYGAWIVTAAGVAGVASGRRRAIVLSGLLAGGVLVGALTPLVPALASFGWAFLLPGMVGGALLFLAWTAWVGAEDHGTDAADGDMRAGRDASRAETRGDAGPGPSVAHHRRLLAAGLLASGVAAAAEATFGIETVVTQLVFWVLAGLVVALALGPGEEASREAVPVSRGAPASESGTITIAWTPGGGALGVAVGGAMGLLLYDFLFYGPDRLPATMPVLLLLVVGTWLAGLVAAWDARESAASAGIAALLVFVAYAVVRVVTLSASDDAAMLYLVTVVWLLVLALVAGWFVRERLARARVVAGVQAILYPLVAVVAVAVLFAMVARPVQADIYFQAAIANFEAARSVVDEQNLAFAQERYAAAETLFDRAEELNPREDTYPLKRAEAYTLLGSMSPDLQTAAHWFQRAQEEIGRARDLDPLMPYHKFNHGHMQLVFAQMVEDEAQRAQFASDAEINLQAAFDAVPYDPHVANELALAKILQGDYVTGVSVLEYVRDSLDAENVLTWQLLSRAYAEVGMVDEAGAAMQRAMELGGGAPEDLVALGDAARRNEDLATAVDYYERAVAAGASNWAVYFNLGLLYRDVGRPEDAVEALAAAAQLAPSEAELEQIQSAMQRVLEDSAGIPQMPQSVPAP